MEYDFHQEQDSQPLMILTIDIGNGQYDKLKIFDLNNIEKETYDFCVKNKLDFSTMKEINNQIQNIIKEKQFQDEVEIENIFQEIKEENENEENISEKTEINENNNNIEEKKRKEESIIIQNSHKNSNETNLDINKKNENYNNNIIFENENINEIEKKNNNDNENNKSINSKEMVLNKNKKEYKFLKKNIKNNIKEAFALAKGQKIENNGLLIKNDKNNIINENNIIENENNLKGKNINTEIKNNKKLKKIYDLERNNSCEVNKNKNMNKLMYKIVNNFNKYNPGKELYDRGLKYIENEKEKLEILKKNLEYEDSEYNTFTPKINKISKKQNNKRKEKRLECSNPEVIKNYRKYKEFKLECLKKKADKYFDKIYTFKPAINRPSSSTKVIKNNNFNNEENIKSTFDRLYNYRIGYEKNNNKLKEKIFKEYSFKPLINENSEFYKLNIPFNERLQTYYNKSKENKIKIKNIYEKEKGYDKSFKPHLNDEENKILLRDRDEFFKNEIQKNNLNIDPYTKLYLYGKKYKKEKTDLIEKYYQSQNKKPEFYEINNEIINKKKEKSLKKIFKLLDSDCDNRITSSNICTSRLPKNILNILEPIFNELKEGNESLNEFEFVFVCEKLYHSLPWNLQRELTTFEDFEKKLIKRAKILNENINYTFKPTINKLKNLFYQKQIRNSNSQKRKNILHKESDNNELDINNDFDKENRKNNISKNNEKKINISEQNIQIINNKSNKNIYNNNKKQDYLVLKNIEINITGKTQNIKRKNKKINYENFINVKNYKK